MKDDLRFEIPKWMTPEEVATTFAAYLLGPRACENRRLPDGTWQLGPYRKLDDDGRWQLDQGNDFFLHIGEGGAAWLDRRYDSGEAICQAMIAVFKAQFPSKSADEAA